MQNVVIFNKTSDNNEDAMAELIERLPLDLVAFGSSPGSSWMFAFVFVFFRCLILIICIALVMSMKLNYSPNESQGRKK